MFLAGNWFVMLIGVVLVISGLMMFKAAFSATVIKKSFIIAAIVAFIIGTCSVVLPISHTKADEVQGPSIVEVLNDKKPKVIRAYYSESSYIEYKDVIQVELADSEVIAFITSDGLRHALRPGANLVEVTEDTHTKER